MDVTAKIGKILPLGLVLSLAAVASPAFADSYVTYDINQPTGSVLGAVASGSFTFDLSTPGISSWDISVTDGATTKVFENGGAQSSSYGFGASAWDAHFSLGGGSKTYLDLYFSAPFTGSSPTTIPLLSKSVEKIGSSGIQVDNPSVSAVPEPGTLALLAAGLGFVGFTMRRRTSG